MGSAKQIMSPLHFSKVVSRGQNPIEIVPGSLIKELLTKREEMVSGQLTGDCEGAEDRYHRKLLTH